MGSIVNLSKKMPRQPKTRSAVSFSLLMLLSSYSALEFGAWEALASSDQDRDGLSYGLEFYINTQPQDWDSDNDGLQQMAGSGSTDLTPSLKMEITDPLEIQMEMHLRISMVSIFNAHGLGSAIYS